MSGAEIFACPFCKKTSPVRLTDSHEGEDDCNSEKFFAVVCDNSSWYGHGPGGCGSQSGFKPTPAEAIFLWNSAPRDEVTTQRN
jgi:hypothetical protein